MDVQQFYPKEMDVAAIDATPSEVTLRIYVRSQSCRCPKCGQESNHRHGTYERKVQDLPILNKRTYLLVNAYEYQCNNPECEVTTFAEHVNGFLSYYGRMSSRLEDFILTLALETSCEAAAHIMKALNIKVSGDTVIRLLLKRYSAQPALECGSTVGVDDFAFKKRHTYGTIIVDEATHKPVAVLDGRDGSALKEWLKSNKHVTAITRDRASAYAKAIEEILPDCMQIADRFHLHQNLMDAVNKILGREIPSTIAVPKDDGTEGIPLPENKMDTDKKIPCAVNNLTAAQARRLELIHTIQELYQQDVSIREISRITGKNRNTVRKYLEGDPEKLCWSNKCGCLDGYKDFIIKCIQEGIIQSKIIEQVIEMGYQRSKSNARQYIMSLVRELGLEPEKYSSKPLGNGGKKAAKTDYITRKGIFRHLWMDSKLSADHHAYIWKKYPVLQEVEKCIRQFRELFTKKNMPFLYLFIERYINSGVKELASFANGLSNDIEVVENAVASELSNGFVEGTNNKVKMMKRAIYGRCGKELLAAKLMYQQDA